MLALDQRRVEIGVANDGDADQAAQELDVVRDADDLGTRASACAQPRQRAGRASASQTISLAIIGS